MAFKAHLKQLKEQSQHRSLRAASETKSLIDLSSNDYLGFKNHPALKKSALEAIENGTELGAGGSRLLRGNAPEHENLETFAAHHYGFEKSLYFANGYMANYALWSTLPSRHDIIVYDELMHACAKDGFRASSAKAFKAIHNDLQSFEDLLKRHQSKAKQLWISVESVYSMDGDIAPLAELYTLAQQYEAILVIDEAHGTGVFGAHGKGLGHALPKENLIIIHTCGKALASAGGIICSDNATIAYLINTAMPFIFSTAPPPIQALITQQAIALCASEAGDKARARLNILRKKAQEIYGGAGTQIVPIVFGASDKALYAAKTMQDCGFDIRAIRPPTVPKNTARLRLSLNANLSVDNLNDFISHAQPLLLKQTS